MPVTTDGMTFINGLGLAFTLLMCLLMLVLPRRFALVPVIILTCYMTMGERLMVAGANFTMIRIVTMAGWTRIIFRGEVRLLKLNPIDKAVVAWAISSIVMYTLLWQTGQAFINRMGFAYDSFGLYFLFRYLVLDLNDIKRTVRILAILIVPLAAAMLAEKMTGRNVFAVFGGVMEFTRTRDGSAPPRGPSPTRSSRVLSGPRTFLYLSECGCNANRIGCLPAWPSYPHWSLLLRRHPADHCSLYLQDLSGSQRGSDGTGSVLSAGRSCSYWSACSW